MSLPWVLLATWLSCSLRGMAHGYGEEIEVNYSDSYYNEISDGEQQEMLTTASPCQSQDLTRWNKLFIMLEDSQMRQNMLLQHIDDMVKVEIGSLRNEVRQLSSSNNRACITALESSCMGMGEQMALRLDQAVRQFREAGNKYQAQQNATLHQLLELSRGQAARLTKLENGCLHGAGLGQMAMKTFPTSTTEQEAATVDGGKLEIALMAIASDLQRVQSQLTLFQRSATLRYLPSGCEMALLFPMRSRRIFAEVTPDKVFPLHSFTVCLWAKVTEALNRTVLFSYGTRRNPHELQLLLASHSVLFTVGGETHLVDAHNMAQEGQWGHFCGVWSSEQGLASLWVNGLQVASSPGVAEGHALPNGGAILLGQEERSTTGFDRDFDPKRAFTGKMTGVNMWDHVLGAERIAQSAKQEGSCDIRGNVIGWGVSEIVPHGGAQYIN